ncbi:serine/threonine-protein kinase [Sorangium sp. So ce1036]|uniref:serine/threonine-protein kinase n=1 Tax=Sorangium sp. So ce1036 TaxID=3133328 RepID=UPI003F0FA18F
MFAERPAGSGPAAPRGAAEDATRAAPLQGRVIAGRYRLVRPLGQGAMGQVWCAHDRVKRLEVAVKFLVAPRMGPDIDVLGRFRFEAQVAAQLGQKTDHIVAVHDAGEDPEAGPYLVMEYVRGRSLRQQIQERGPVPAQELASLLCQVAEALSVAHGLGIVHRDIKPSNILLVEGRHGRLRAKVADFGIAKWIRKELPADFPRQTADGLVLGTPAYLSPEHTCEGHADPQLDMWSLAVVAHEALTGRQPFPGRNLADVLGGILAGDRPPLATLCPEAPEALEPWFARAFALDPAERFPSIPQMIAGFLDAVGEAAPQSAGPQSAGPRSAGPQSAGPRSTGPRSTGTPAQAAATPAPRRRLRLAVAGLVAALGLSLPAGLLWTRSNATAAQTAESGAARAAARLVQAALARATSRASARAALAPAAEPAAADAASQPGAEPPPPPAPIVEPSRAAEPSPTSTSVVAAPPATAPSPAPTSAPAAAPPARAPRAPQGATRAPTPKRAHDAGSWKSTIF